MNNKPKNPHAFPVVGSDFYSDSEGMTLRDYFAGQALTGILSNNSNDHKTSKDIVRESYALADEMLAERERSND